MTPRGGWDPIYSDPERAGRAWKDNGDLFVLDRLVPGLTPETRVLEVGCGDGRNMIHLLRLGFSVTGIDISAAALARAADLAESYGVAQRLSLFQGNAEGCQLASSSFDVAYSTQVLDHVDDPESVIRETRRLLRPGGRFFAQLSTTDDAAMLLGEYVGVNERDYHGFRFRFFTRAEIDALFAEWMVDEVARVIIQDPPHAGWRDEPHEHNYWVVSASKANT